MKGDYRITYYYGNGDHDSELGWLEKGQSQPDITLLKLPRHTTMVDIGFHSPLEHVLIQRENVYLPKVIDGWRFHAQYYPHAELATYNEAEFNSLMVKAYKHTFQQAIKDAIRYGVDYAGYGVDPIGKSYKQKEDMLYVRTCMNTVAVMTENSAILTLVDPNAYNERGAVWEKTNPFNLVYDL